MAFLWQRCRFCQGATSTAAYVCALHSRGASSNSAMVSKGTNVSVKVETLVLFGATGDLAQRMLFPSLYNLHLDGLLADALTILGSGRSKMDRAAFHAQVRAALTEHLPPDTIEESSVA